jgi:hypothetical protein
MRCTVATSAVCILVVAGFLLLRPDLPGPAGKLTAQTPPAEPAAEPAAHPADKPAGDPQLADLGGAIIDVDVREVERNARTRELLKRHGFSFC